MQRYELAKHHSNNNISNKLLSFPILDLMGVGIQMSFVEFIPSNWQITHIVMRKLRFMVIGKEVLVRDSIKR